MGKENAISQCIRRMNSTNDRDNKHVARIRAEIYRLIGVTAKRIRPRIQMSYCHKEFPLNGLAGTRNCEQCNCVL